MCGYSYKADYVAALGHTSETVSGKAPTCTDTGLTDGSKCSVCGDILLAQNVIPANGHVDADPKDYTCDVCEADLCTNHNVEILLAKAPTCTENGLTEGKKCSICADVLLPQESIPALGHSYDSVVTAPDCVNGGYTTYTCAACGDSYVDDKTSALGHSYEAVVTAPDCVNNGYTTYTCAACGDSYIADNTSALGHSYEAVVTAPDCVNNGYTTYTCAACGDSYIADNTAALGHSYDAVVTAPDCVNGGYTAYTCSACGESYVADETDALGHSYDAVVTEPDCVNGGYTTYTCSSCGNRYVADETDALDHSWNPATTESAETCDRCGETRGDKLPESQPEDVEDDHSECAPKSEFERIIYMIINFFRSLIGLPEECYCGKELN